MVPILKNAIIKPSQTKTPQHLSAGEVHYLWFFIQGTIMEPFIRRHLRESWSFCQRHTASWLIVESALRQNYLHGPTILYEDLIERAQKCLKHENLPFISAIRLRSKKPCLMCSEGYDATTKAYAEEEMIRRGSDLAHIQEYAEETSAYWKKFVCWKCTDSLVGNGYLCRPHFIEEVLQGKVETASLQREMIWYLVEQLNAYGRSFRWEYRDTETIESKASLITAAGWCSGWTDMLNLFEI